MILLGGLAFRRTMDDRVEVMVEELGEVERRRPERVFVGIRGVRDIMVGEAYDYEPWFGDGKMESADICPP